VGAVPSTVRLAIRRFEAAGLTSPLSDDITDTELEVQLFAGTGARSRHPARPSPASRAGLGFGAPRAAPRQSSLSNETRELLDRAERAIDQAIRLREHTRQCIAEAERRSFQLELSL
jgi:hypothetical protein